MQNDQQSIFESLKGQEPQAWRAYLRPFEEGEPITGPSMLVIYPYAERLAMDQSSLDWAEVAVRAAELQAHCHSGIEREDALLSAMQLRAWFISKMGSRSNHFILDKAIILNWVMDGVEISVETAKAKALVIGKRLVGVKNSSSSAEKQQVLEDLRLLRRIKRRLKVLKALADCGEVPNDSPLHQWLEVREQLP